MKKETEGSFLLETFDREGRRVAWTPHESCVPSKSVFQSRQKDGLRYKLNGKFVKSYDVVEEAVKRAGN